MKRRRSLYVLPGVASVGLGMATISITPVVAEEPRQNVCYEAPATGNLGEFADYIQRCCRAPYLDPIRHVPESCYPY